MTTDRPSSTLRSLQAARGVAVVLVVMYHCTTAIFTLPKYGGRDPFDGLFLFGRFGVELFFVLSGFVMLLAHRGDLSRPRELGRYVQKRFVRIYPLYWVVLLLTVPLYAVDPGFGTGSELRPLTVLSSFSLVHVGTTSVISVVSWTLFHEVLFYALFASLIVGRRLGSVVLLSWWALVAVQAAIGSDRAGFTLSDYNLLFGFGIAAFVASERGLVRWPGTIAVVGSVGFVANGLASTDASPTGPVTTHLLAGLASASLLAGFVVLERQGRLRVPALLRFTGDASYSIYLVHFPVLSGLAKLALPSLCRLVPSPVVATMLAALSVAAGMAVHLLLERPLLAMLPPRGGLRTGAIAVGGRDVGRLVTG